MILGDEAIDLVSAALRHVRDAEGLADPGNPHRSPDQAFHLAGYGPECARKATLRTRELDRTIGHRFGAATDDVLDFALALDAFALRYEPRDWGRRYPALAAWRETVRYERTGSVVRHKIDVAATVSQAREAVEGVVAALWADGRFPDGKEPW